jgi:hypothetical protein
MGLGLLNAQHLEAIPKWKRESSVWMMALRGLAGTQLRLDESKKKGSHKILDRQAKLGIYPKPPAKNG